VPKVHVSIRGPRSAAIALDYIAGEKLGAGAFSEVYRVQQKQGGRFFAAKKISKLSDNYHHESLEREISIMKEVDHPNCMRLVSVYDEPTACVLVLEIVKGSSMLDRLVTMLRVNPGCFYAEPVAAKVLEGCLSGLRCIHSMKIAHLDLKPENIMFVTDDEHSEFYNVVKLCDFGLARKVASDYDVMGTVCGTPGFMAPEMLARIGYTRQADMYSMGAIMHWMFSGRLPHDQEDWQIEHFLKMALENKLGLPPKQAERVSSNAKDLLGSMLEWDPTKRCTASVALEHPWIKYQGTSFCAAVSRNHWLNYTLRRTVFDNFDGEEAEHSLGLLTSMMERTTYEPGETVQIDGSFEGLFFVESGTIALQTQAKQEDATESRAGAEGGLCVTCFTEGSLLMPLSLFLPDREISGDTKLAVPKDRLRFPANVYTLNAASLRVNCQYVIQGTRC
jgi:serine/threonine protein kinase